MALKTIQVLYIVHHYYKPQNEINAGYGANKCRKIQSLKMKKKKIQWTGKKKDNYLEKLR